MTKIQALKQFFGTEEKPVTNPELLDFAKNDRAGFDELGELVRIHMGIDEFDKK